MLKPISWLLLACIGAAAAGCHRTATDQGAAVAAAANALPPPRSEAPRSVRLAIQLVAMRTPSRHLAPAAPRVVEPSHDLYDAPGVKPPEAAPADASGFRLTVPLCRRAERLGDPLARTPECAQLIAAAKQQAEACKQAFENGDDKSALSPACRQAAGFR